MKDINYSIIIPHKNIPDLLQRCLDSIPRREDIQIIVVDDNSDSDKVDFGHFPGIDEPNIEIYFTKESRGAGYARNVGLEHARGKWLLFADADDYYTDGFIDSLDVYVNFEYDILYYNVCSNVSGKYDRSIYINDIYERYFKRKIRLYSFKFLTWSPWNKMFSSDFIMRNNIKFEEIPIGNDAFFSLIANEKTENIFVIKDKLYCITYNPQSITYSKRTFQREVDSLMINIRINTFLKERGLKKQQMPLFSLGSLFSLWKSLGYKNLLCYIRIIFENDFLWRSMMLYLKEIVTVKMQQIIR